MSDSNKLPNSLPILPLVDKVIFPGLVIRLHVHKSNGDNHDDIRETAKDPSQSSDPLFFDPNVVSNILSQVESGVNPYLACIPIASSEIPSLASQQDGDIWDSVPQFSDGYPLKNKIICMTRVISMRKSPVFAGGMFIVLEGLSRAQVMDVQYSSGNLPLANVQIINEPELSELSQTEKSLYSSLQSTSAELVTLLKDLNLPPQMISQMKQLMEQTTPGSLADLVASLMETEFQFKVGVLQAVDHETRLARADEMLKAQLKVLKLARQTQKLDPRNRRFRPQIKNEANQASPKEDDDDVTELSRKIESLALPDEIRKMANRELRRLKRLQPIMADYQVIRNYLEWISELPWGVSSADSLDVEKARQQLADDHFGLENVKKRILEYLAVCNLRKDVKAPILCLAGPPGVGKTSLGKSIANALGRKFYRISLGGVRDEAEIRGHRRTYVGAMPGLLIQGLRKCGVDNPVILLDEVDKVGTNSHHGDPSAALLEVLDPEQNSTFTDHYINAPVDLSKVLFIATANRLDTIPTPLLDRMEVVELSGYTIYQKQHIASRHLIPKHVTAHGLNPEAFKITDDALCDVITKYTSEAGVRSLDREIASICRFKAVDFSEKGATDSQNSSYNPSVGVSDLESILGIAKYHDDISDKNLLPGVAVGLVYTGSGSGKIMFLEAGKMPGTGQLILTGKLGDVLKESAQLGLSWVKGHAYQMGLTSSRREKLVDQLDIHLHLPAGATPKDGPSAGVAIVSALVSLFTQVPLPSHTAMTGEITLRGQVLPVGGIREKVISAHRAGIKTLLIPAQNRPQVNPTDLPDAVLKDIKFHFIDNLPQALDILFKSMFNFNTPNPKFGLFSNL